MDFPAAQPARLLSSWPVHTSRHSVALSNTHMVLTLVSPEYLIPFPSRMLVLQSSTHAALFPSTLYMSFCAPEPVDFQETDLGNGVVKSELDAALCRPLSLWCPGVSGQQSEACLSCSFLGVVLPGRQQAAVLGT